MLTGSQRAALTNTDCDVAFDATTRHLYATDASIYRIEPSAIAFPRNADQAGSIIRAAADAGISIIPRGAGTGLAGGAIGDGLIVEFARFNRRIDELDLESRTVRVGAGVVLDQLNTFLRPHGFRFGPDVATSSRATLGGMVANNSSGSHVPVYGTTGDHVESLEIVLADGRVERIGNAYDTLQTQRQLAAQLTQKHTAEISDRMPATLLKRWPGYNLSRFVNDSENLVHLLTGSEGTLAAISSAKLRIVPLPRQKGLALIFFASVPEAMQATVELLGLKPAAIEHIDRVLFDQTKNQLPFQAARALLELDSKPCESILLVEFFEDIEERLALVAGKRLGLRTTILKSAAEMALVWELRKAGLSLLTGRKGAAKPVTGIEDTAVLPERLPEYVAGLESIFRPLELEVCYYGHAATGLLHVRPVLDLHTTEGVKQFRQVMDQVSALVRQFKGSLAAEHGVGIARTEYMSEHLGADLLEVHRAIKTSFDPQHRFNPGKIMGDGRFKTDGLLRIGAGYELELPFEPVLAFAAKDKSFVGNLEQCNGCGGCRKESPTMCPTFLATGEEIMSTRGRANVIRAALEHRDFGQQHPLDCEALESVLSDCLSCKARTTECPSNVNMALLKAELAHARQQRHGRSWREELLSRVDVLGGLGCLAPAMANATLEWPWLRQVLQKFLGLSARRPLPPFAGEPFDHWFARRPERSPRQTRGRVFLWDDTFVRYHEPEIGRAAVKVLETAGFEVRLFTQRACCGRPAFSQGNLERAAALGRHNLALLNHGNGGEPIIFLEPSCYSMFVEDYRELKLPHAERVATRCVLFEEFVERLLAKEPDAIRFERGEQNAMIHSHCHAKSLTNPVYMTRLAQRATAGKVTLLDTGCCGMAGAFGAIESKYDLSLKIAEPLVRQIRQQPEGAIVVASGTSCRHQIQHLTSDRAKHMAELLADRTVG